jgi:hypothetical protein
MENHFLAGLAAGFGLAGWLAVCIIGTLRMIGGMNGIEMDTMRFIARQNRNGDEDNNALEDIGADAPNPQR